MKLLVIVAVFLAAAAAFAAEEAPAAPAEPAAPAVKVKYAVNISTIYEVDESSAEFAEAMGVPAVSRVDTAATFELERLDGGAFRLTFLTASQQTVTASAVIPDVEKLGANLAGRWIEFAPRTMGTGGVSRAPGFEKDSEEISYSLLALMLVPPGGPLDGLWGGVARAAAARSYGVKVISMEDAEGQPLPAFEGQDVRTFDFSVVFRQQLSQETAFSRMTGDASFEGAGAAAAAADGLTTFARLDLVGNRARAFVIGGAGRDLAEHVAISMRLTRDGYVLPEGWAITEETPGE